MDLVHYGDVLDQDILGLVTRRLGPDFGSASLELSEKLRDLGIMGLLMEDSAESFSGYLVRSGLSRLIFLERLASAKAEDSSRCSSFIEPLLDAIAGGDRRLAARIAEATPGGEPCGDTQDFYYSQIVQKLVVDEPTADSQALLREFKASGGGPRFEICLALVERNVDGFDSAFERLLDHVQKALGAYAEWDYPGFEKRFADFGSIDAVMDVYNGVRTDDESLDAYGDLEEEVRRGGRQVFVEGLALLQLAESRGLAVRSGYRYCPARARGLKNTWFDWAAFLNQLPRTPGVG